jgi:hypothetical protein
MASASIAKDGIRVPVRRVYLNVAADGTLSSGPSQLRRSQRPLFDACVHLQLRRLRLKPQTCVEQVRGASQHVQHDIDTHTGHK